MSDYTCPICSELLKGDIVVVKHQCDDNLSVSRKKGHYFHRECITKWKHKLCPLDRGPYTRLYNVNYKVLGGKVLDNFSSYYELLNSVKINDDLIKNIRNINCQDTKGRTLFYVLCQRKKISFKTLKKLLRLGTDPTIGNFDSFTPLMVLISNFQYLETNFLLSLEQIRKSIGCHDSKGKSAFEYACLSGNINAIREILGYYLIKKKEINQILLFNQSRIKKGRNGMIILEELRSYINLLEKI